VNQRIILGTRGSDLALTQSRMVETALRTRWPDSQIEIRIIRTSGDEGVGSPPVSVQGPAGRKGLFTAEIERALIAGTIDVAVHSAKDLPSVLGAGTQIAAVLPRANVDDVLVSPNNYDLDSLPRDGFIATGSVRRRHQLRWNRPDLHIIDLRGNVPTRLRKLAREQWHGAILARAGLERLGLMPNESAVELEDCRFAASILPREIFVPAGGQGIVTMQIRSEDERSQRLLDAINDPVTRICLRAEREFLRLLHGDCDQPVGVFAIVNGNLMRMRGQVFQLEATTPQEAAVEGQAKDAEKLAAELLERIDDR
jgi:hydroxymethylbilane synthase